MTQLQAMAPEQAQAKDTMPLRSDLTDAHFSQIFFLVGHVAIKMLSFVDFLETELKSSLTAPEPHQ